MKQKQTINIGDTDKNADWIKTPKNRKTEAEIHAKLAEQHAKVDDEQ